MEKIGDLMKRLGFRPDAPFETQKAFIRNASRAAGLGRPANSPEAPVAPEPEEQQLSFDFEKACDRKSG